MTLLSVRYILAASCAWAVSGVHDRVLAFSFTNNIHFRKQWSTRSCPCTVLSAGIPVFDLRQAPSEQLYNQVRSACEDIGFFCITGHGIPEEIFEETRASAREAVFDLPVAEKKNLAVAGMQLSRGWEMSPQHREYMHALLSSRELLVAQKHPEISAEEGIMTERFCIGPEVANPRPPTRLMKMNAILPSPPQPTTFPPAIAAQASCGAAGGTLEEDAIFLRPNVWPDGPRGARLRAAMTACYARMEDVSEARPPRPAPPPRVEDGRCAPRARAPPILHA
jgi:isopenicillin N synthase-like dioxygenase